MLGKVVHKPTLEERQHCSTKLTDLILDNWIENISGRQATLEKQEDAWKEFWLYASDTKNWCPRLCAIRSLCKPIDDVVNAEGRWNMGQGTYLHRLFQESVLPSLGDRFMGAWKTRVPYRDSSVATVEYRQHYRDPILNDGEARDFVRTWGVRPGGSEWQYEESKVRMPKYRIVVKFDGILDLDLDGNLEVFELKSEKESARDLLDPFVGGAPRPYHVEQCNLGMFASGIKRSRLTYVFKGSPSLKASLLEHVLPYDEQIIYRLKNTALKCVDAVRLCDELMSKNDISKFLPDALTRMDWLDTYVPRLDECPMKSKEKARFCAGRDVCFPDGYRKKRG